MTETSRETQKKRNRLPWLQYFREKIVFRTPPIQQALYSRRGPASRTISENFAWGQISKIKISRRA